MNTPNALLPPTVAPVLPMLIGCDFSSSPSRAKPIVLATGQLAGSRVVLTGLERFDTLAGFGQWLAGPRAWVGGFDLPFGLPRELLSHLNWPLTWQASIHHYRSLSRAQIRDTFAAFCDARPVGAKFAHRATDGSAGSSPSMKWVNPPVAYMLHAGVPLLLDAGVHLPGLHDGDPGRVALEAYPGLLAREILARRSYKSDDRAKQTPDRLIARKDLVTALENGATRLGLRLKLTHAQRDALVDDASGDRLDAVLCLVQAAWALQRHQQGDVLYGLPPGLDPLEGWIVSAPWPERAAGAPAAAR
ncbi:DUF429 domain-containing protein [Acidovorax sp. SUPP3334]|uniref:DUF429 domain-containing protein n=1 Tax=Acidovorax sp. SUPP3334 TaxID=2920881 RepID=UPI0023DE69B8|nr:DUF429 domain-containing protein [Acidovorax sp. SUPP3334]GKT20363.1 DUF429 domain-containing protein [Acidovorax sp. SUPP3334]